MSHGGRSHVITRIRRPLTRVLELERGAVVLTIRPDGVLVFRGLRRHRKYTLALEPLVENALPPREYRSSELALEEVSS